jgi:hypothetical protein
MVGVALESITKLLGFFRSDYKVGGSEITLDDIALVQAVVGQDLGIPSFVPSIYNPAVVEGAAKLVEAELSELSTQFAQSRMLADDLEQLIRQRQEQAGQATITASLKLSLEREVATLRGLSDRLKTAATGYDTVLARLMAPDEATASIFRNLAIWNALKDGGAYLLVLKVQRAGGSHYTEKNLWNFFGKMPFYVAGGVVVSYTLFKGNDGAVVASGVMPVHGGFESVTRVPTLK